MLDNNFVEKIKLIIESYKSINAKVWIVGTDVYGSTCRLLENLKIASNGEILNKNLIISEKEPQIVRFAKKDEVQDRYWLYFNEKMITPTWKLSKAIGGVADVTIKQYIQESTALGFINAEQNFKIYPNREFKLLPKIWNCLNQKISDFVLENFIKLLTRSCCSLLYYEKNIGYSIFLCMLASSKQMVEIFKENIDCQIESKQKNRKNSLGVVSWNDPNFPKIIRDKVRDNSNTYTKLCKEILNINDHIIFDIVNEMVDNIRHFCPDIYKKHHLKIKNSSPSIQDQKALINKNIGNSAILMLQRRIVDAKHKIEILRKKIKEQIEMSRVKGLEKYSDLEYIVPSCTRNLIPCHIYEIHSIKSEVEQIILHNGTELEIEKCMDQAYDPANAILMSSTCNNLFDQGCFGFDPNNGLIWIREDELAKARVIDAFHIAEENAYKIQIKSDVLTPDMQNYLRKRL